MIVKSEVFCICNKYDRQSRGDTICGPFKRISPMLLKAAGRNFDKKGELSP